MPVIDENAHADTFTTPAPFSELPLDEEFVMDDQLWVKSGRTSATKAEWPGKGSVRNVRPQLVVKVAEL